MLVACIVQLHITQLKHYKINANTGQTQLVYPPPPIYLHFSTLAGSPQFSSSTCSERETSRISGTAFWMGWMSFLPHNQQCLGTEGSKAQDTVSGLATYFLHSLPDARGKTHCFRYTGSRAPVPWSCPTAELFQLSGTEFQTAELAKQRHEYRKMLQWTCGTVIKNSICITSPVFQNRSHPATLQACMS